MKFLSRINKYIVTHRKEKDNDAFKDDYVTHCMGAFGYNQALICFITSLVRLIVPWNFISIVFLTPSTQFSCVKFKNESDISRLVEMKNSTCYEDCVKYEYKSEVFEETLISRFGLICENDWLKSFTQTAVMFGLVLGVFGSGWISDRFGRRKAFLLTTSVAVTFMLAAPFSPTYWVFTGIRVFIGMGIGGIMNLTVVINIELIGQKYREIAGAMSLLPDGVAQILIAVIAYNTSTWSSMLLVCGAVSLVILMTAPLVPESPRWLVAQGRGEEAVAMMSKVARFNKLSTTHIKETVDKAIEDMRSHQKELKLQTYHPIDLFRTAYLARITVSSNLVWVCGGICFFGLNHYSTLLGLNIYVVVPLMGSLQVIGPFFTSYLNRHLGRKIATFGLFCIIGTTMVILVFIPDGHWGCTVTSGIGLMASGMLFGVIYTQVNEMYPTPLRNMGLGASSAGSKTGAMIAPFIANIYPHWVASTIFAVIPFVGATLSLLLPETKGKTLKDTID